MNPSPIKGGNLKGYERRRIMTKEEFYLLEFTGSE
jgi:hypothetical protein